MATRSMLFKYLCLVAGICCTVPHKICAQRRTKNSIFKAGIIAGFNRSQIDGDDQFGYHKPGTLIGLRGAVILHKNFEVGMELLYSQRGAQPKTGQTSGGQKSIFIDVDYAEAPILAKIMLPRSETRVVGMDLYAGASYSRLVRSNVKPLLSAYQPDTARLNHINKKGIRSTDVCFIVGGSFYFGRRLGVTVRHTVAMRPFYNNPVPPRPTPRQLDNYHFFRTYYWSAALFYDFISPKPQKARRTPGPKTPRLVPSSGR